MGEIKVKVTREYHGVPYSVEACLMDVKQTEMLGQIVGLVEQKIDELQRPKPCACCGRHRPLLPSGVCAECAKKLASQVAINRGKTKQNS